jgi:hypothetical protein
MRRRLSPAADWGPFPRLSGHFRRKPPLSVPFSHGLSAKTPSFPAAISRQCEKTPLLPPAILTSRQTSPAAIFGPRD